ncbi:MAG: hypothetical protein ACP5F9_00925 [Thiomonas sp.]|jgi:hypothetical protein
MFRDAVFAAGFSASHGCAAAHALSTAAALLLCGLLLLALPAKTARD